MLKGHSTGAFSVAWHLPPAAQPSVSWRKWVSGKSSNSLLPGDTSPTTPLLLTIIICICVWAEYLWPSTSLRPPNCLFYSSIAHEWFTSGKVNRTPSPSVSSSVKWDNIPHRVERGLNKWVTSVVLRNADAVLANAVSIVSSDSVWPSFLWFIYVHERRKGGLARNL